MGDLLGVRPVPLRGLQLLLALLVLPAVVQPFFHFIDIRVRKHLVSFIFLTRVPARFRQLDLYLNCFHREGH
jgi:hypothetical protein